MVMVVSRRWGRVAALALALVVAVAACSGGGGGESAATSAQDSTSAPSTSAPAPTSTTSIAPTTVVVTTTTEPPGPAVEPVVIDLEADPAAQTLLSDSAAQLLDSVSFHFRKDITYASAFDPTFLIPVSMEGTVAEGVVTPKGASVRGDEGELLLQTFGDDPQSSAVLQSRSEDLYYEAIDTADGVFVHAPVIGVLDEMFLAPSSVKASDRPLVEGWVRLDASPPAFLFDAMGFGGDPFPTDPRELLDLIGFGGTAGSPTSDEVEGRSLTRVEVVVPLADLVEINGDGDVSTYVDAFDSLGAFSVDTLDALGRALLGSDALVTVWFDEDDLINRIEYDLGADAVAPALNNPDLIDALDFLGLEEHIVFTLDRFGDPGNTVETPSDFTPFDMSTLGF